MPQVEHAQGGEQRVERGDHRNDAGEAGGASPVLDASQPRHSHVADMPPADAPAANGGPQGGAEHQAPVNGRNQPASVNREGTVYFYDTSSP